MLLLITHQSDLHADLVVAECARRGVRAVRLNTERYPQDVTLDLHLDCMRWSGTLTVPSQGETAIDEITSVWYRGLKIAKPDCAETAVARFVQTEVTSTLTSFLNMLADRYWISPPCSITAADDKAHQLIRAQQYGLQVPKTILTTNPAAIYDLLDRSGPFLVAKRLSLPTAGEPIAYTTELHRGTVDLYLSDFKYCPTLLQERIPKLVDIRVAVIYDTTFAVEIHSQENTKTKADWRRTPITNLRCLPHDLPKHVRDALVSLTAAYGLRYSAPDLILTPRGDYIFLELNPNGQWAWMESLTSLPITARLVDVLMTQPSCAVAK